MIRGIARQSEAERSRRAKVIYADGEFEASRRLVDAARALSADPRAMQLRYLQTLSDIGMEKNTTVVFPLPLDLITPLLQRGTPPAGPDSSPSP
jgi:regulator of protease activity HflC (stomatin/prohibitin superfamily)